MMGRHPFTATRLRLALSSSLFVIAILTGISLYFIYGKLHDVSTDVSHAVVDASASQDNIQTLQKIQSELADKKDVIDRASSIVADSKSYQYQNQILNDLNDYAGRAGITLTNIDFTSGDATGTTGSGAKPAADSSAPAGVKSTSVSVAIQNPVPYDNLLRFIKSIEDNLTKMQISKIGLSKGTSGSNVSSEILTIQVYIR